MSRASCHSAGLKAKLEMVWQVQFLPGTGTLKCAVGPRQEASAAAVNAFPEAVQMLGCP